MFADRSGVLCCAPLSTFRVLSLTLLLVLSTGQVHSLFAQSERGTVSGEVRDSSGAVIQGAKVTLTDVATNAANSATTNMSGAFTFPNLPVGQYSWHVDKDGFRRRSSATLQ
jgi:hypothetical protein